MTFDRIRPELIIVVHFLLLIISHASLTGIPLNCSNDSSNGPCTYIKYESEDECAAQDLSGKANDALGDFTLETIKSKAATVNKMSQFNLTFSNIHWTRATFRFNTKELNGTRYVACREYILNGTVNPETYISFTNNWRWRSLANQNCSLEVQLEGDFGKSYRKLIFKIPEFGETFEPDSKKWRVFSYLEIMSPSEVMLRWQPHLNLGPFNYTVTAESDVDVETKNVNGASAKFDMSSSASWYKFRVQPVGAACPETGCLERIIVLDIEHVPLSNVLYIAIPMVALLGIITAFFLVFVPAKKRYRLEGLEEKTVLVMYKGNHKFHTDYVKELVKVLKNKKMKVLLDLEGIPELPNPDPHRWCSKSVEIADVIAIVSSPSCCPLRGDSIYNTKVHELLEKEIRNCVPRTTCRLVRLLLPYCSTSDFPSHMNYRMFSVPHQLSSFINYVHGLSDIVQTMVLPLSPRDDSEVRELRLASANACEVMANHERDQPQSEETESTVLEIGDTERLLPPISTENNVEIENKERSFLNGLNLLNPPLP